MTRAAVLVPGYGGTKDQAILRQLGAALAEVGVTSKGITFSTRGSRPSRTYEREMDEVRAARDALRARGAERVALVGRSFGGRICAFVAAEEPPDALVIVGHPISPPGRPRPADERALAGVTCPTLVVQGDRDELGPLAVLERIAGENPRIDLVAVRGADHGLRGGHALAARTAVARWLDTILR